MMTDTSNTQEQIPAVPLTLDGSYLLHQMFRIRWSQWNGIDSKAQRNTIEKTVELLSTWENKTQEPTGLFSLLGHKGDLLVIHFRKTLDELNQAELALAKTPLQEFLEPTTSYVSVVELGIYEASVKIYRELAGKGLQPGTADWNREIEAELSKQRQASAARLSPEIPQRRYVCFYPMNKFRGENKNWYSESIGERQRMMREHGMIGRHYAGRVTQIISGSIGFDDWEWGVDLFADDPLVFKKLVYEMRFDEASAVYGLFGTFYVGLQFPVSQLETLLDGKTPSFS